jgi:phosphotransferase system HPr (HPr) family protein
MLEEKITVKSEEGLHTRPANRFVQLVKQFTCAVVISKGEKEAPGKSLLKIMKMGVVQGDEVTLFCDGPDEDAAMNALKELLIKGPVEAGEPA